jgi:hypothetical protein
MPTRRELWETLHQAVAAEVVESCPPFTIAMAGVLYGERYYIAYGAARCCYRDKWNPTTGANIAKGRAISRLLDKLMTAQKEGGQ